MNVIGPSCPSIHITQLLQNGVARTIIRELLCGKKHFGQLKAVAPKKTLTSQLEKLVALGLVQNQTHEHDASQTTYALTPQGEAVRPIIRAIDLLSDNNLPSANSSELLN